MAHTKIVDGYITVVQEQRFRLITKAGRGLLFTLAHNANLDAEELMRLKQIHATVQVVYEGEPDFAQALAHRVSQHIDRSPPHVTTPPKNRSTT